VYLEGGALVLQRRLSTSQKSGAGKKDKPPLDGGPEPFLTPIPQALFCEDWLRPCLWHPRR